MERLYNVDVETETFKVDDKFRIDILIHSNGGYEAWLYNIDYPVKECIGISKKELLEYDEFVDMIGLSLKCESFIEDYINDYMK